MASSISAGTTSSTALVATADTSGVLQLASNNGSVAVTVGTDQNVGVGTTSPLARLHVDSGSAGELQRYNSSNTAPYVPWYISGTRKAYQQWDSAYGWILDSEAASTGIVFRTQNTERMRIDSSGNVGIGTTSPSTKLTTYQAGDGLHVKATNNTFYSAMGVSAGASAGYFDVASATNMLFTRGGTESMRLDSSGNLLVAATNTTLGTIGCQIFASGYYQATSNGAPAMILKRGSNDGAIVDFYDSGGNRRGYINVTTSATTYNTISDYRLKEDVAPMTGALAKVAALKPVTYKWKADGSYGQGFIAHELQSVVPDCVVGEKDAVNENGDPSYQGIDTSFLVATLTAAIQELTAKVTALEAKVGASA